MGYDSTQDTKDHIEEVRKNLDLIIERLGLRALFHDSSKLEEPEKLLFDTYTPLLRDCTYGSPQYYKYMDAMGPALAHHYDNNSHHPEHFPRPQDPEIPKIVEYIDGMREDDPARDWLFAYLREKRSRVNKMSLIDIIEMLSDWKAAGMRHKDGDILASLEINRKRFEISDQLFEILVNTVREIEW